MGSGVGMLSSEPDSAIYELPDLGKFLKLYVPQFPMLNGDHIQA